MKITHHIIRVKESELDTIEFAMNEYVENGISDIVNSKWTDTVAKGIEKLMDSYGEEINILHSINGYENLSNIFYLTIDGKYRCVEVLEDVYSYEEKFKKIIEVLINEKLQEGEVSKTTKTKK